MQEENIGWPTRQKAKVIVEDDGALICKHCGGRNLHSGGVHVVQRVEDQDGVLVAVSIEGDARLAQFKAKEVKCRRQFIRIAFRCECGGGQTLEIQQHKGTTFLEWLEPKSADDKDSQSLLIQRPQMPTAFGDE